MPNPIPSVSDGQCPFCQSEQFREVNRVMKPSKIYCVNCFAIFEPVEDGGEFTGAYMPGNKEFYVKHSFYKDKQEGEE